MKRVHRISAGSEQTRLSEGKYFHERKKIPIFDSPFLLAPIKYKIILAPTGEHLDWKEIRGNGKSNKKIDSSYFPSADPIHSQ